MSTQTSTTYVKNNTWGINDEYLTVDIQVDSSKFKRGEHVKVTVESISD